MSTGSCIEIMCNTKWFYHTLLYNKSYNDCTFVRHLDDGHSNDRNMLVESNDV